MVKKTGKLYSNHKAISSKNQNWYFLEKKYFSPYIHYIHPHAFQNTVLGVQLQICFILKYFSLLGVLEGNRIDFTFSKGSSSPIISTKIFLEVRLKKKLRVQIIYKQCENDTWNHQEVLPPFQVNGNLMI